MTPQNIFISNRHVNLREGAQEISRKFDIKRISYGKTKKSVTPQNINVCSCHLSFYAISIYKGYPGLSLTMVSRHGEKELSGQRLENVPRPTIAHKKRDRDRSRFLDPT